MDSWIWIRIRTANADPDPERGKSAPGIRIQKGENQPLKRRKIKSEDQKKMIQINIFYAIIF
jgi:hypothetical protein